jgi:hypothetical protein
VNDLPNEELRARLAAITRGPWAQGVVEARQKLAPVDRIASTGTARVIDLERLALSASNKRKSGRLSKVLRIHFLDGDVDDEEEMNTRDALDQALTLAQLYELAVQTGYLPERCVRKPARDILTGLLWSGPARRFVRAYDYLAVPMLAARVGKSGFTITNPPDPNPKAALRFAGFLAHLRAFHTDERIDLWVGFLDDYLIADNEQDLVWEFLRGRRKTPPRRIGDLLTGCQLFVTSLSSAFHILSDHELGPYGLMHAYWLQKFFGYKRNGEGQFVKNAKEWGEADSWAQTISTSPALAAPGTDPSIEKIVRQQFLEEVALLGRTFEAVRGLTLQTRQTTRRSERLVKLTERTR